MSLSLVSSRLTLLAPFVRPSRRSESTEAACALEADRLAASADKGAVQEALVRARSQLEEEATRARQEGTAAVAARLR
jgi:hypothetical protein